MFNRALDFWFGFEGRIRQGPYILAIVTHALILLSVQAVGAYNVDLVYVLAVCILPWAAWSAPAMSAKRWHDLDKSGWLCLLLFIPLLGALVHIGLAFVPGGANSYKEIKEMPRDLHY